MAALNIDPEFYNDLFIHIIKFLNHENLVLVGGFSLIAMLFFFAGRFCRKQNKNILNILRKRYENVGHQRKRIEHQIHRYTYYHKFLYRSKKILFGIMIGFFGYGFFDDNYSFQFHFMRSLNFIPLVLLSGIFLMLLLHGIDYFVRKFIEKKRLFLKNLEKNLEDLTKDILKDIGPELTNIIKDKILKTVEPKTIIKEVPTFQNVVVQSNTEKALIEEINFLKQAWELQTTISNIELKRHQEFVNSMINFEWCESCGNKGTKAEMVDHQKVIENTSKDVSENLDSKEMEANEKYQEKAEETENKSKIVEANSEDNCTNNCLSRFFKSAQEVGARFKEKESEISTNNLELDLLYQSKMKLKRSLTLK